MQAGKFTLRDYQVEFCDAIEYALQKHDSALGVMATGLGKTVCFVHLMDQHEGRCLLIAPMIELIDQAADKIHQVTGEYPSIERAHHRSNESGLARSKFVVASKQTLAGKSGRHKRLRDISMVVYDEAHTAGTAKARDLLNYYRDQGAKLIGVTATPNRHDGRSLGELFETCPYEMGIADAVQRGWLCRPMAKCVQVDSLDLSQVTTKGKRGDFKDGELAAVMRDDRVCMEIAAVTAAESRGDKTIVFCASVEEATKVAAFLNSIHHIPSAMVCSDTKKCSLEDRRSRLENFKRGHLQVLTNVGIVTTGFDCPDVSHIVMARPTKSTVLYTQCIGRATRPLPGIVDIPGGDVDRRLAAIAMSDKPYFRITDLVDASRRHKLVRAHDALAGSPIPDDELPLLDNKSDSGKQHDVLEEMRDAKVKTEKARQARRAAEERNALLYGQLDIHANYTADEIDLFTKQRTREMETGSSRRMPFGKFKGEPISSLPIWYLKWLTGRPLTKQMQRTVNRELILRGSRVGPTPMIGRPKNTKKNKKNKSGLKRWPGLSNVGIDDF